MHRWYSARANSPFLAFQVDIEHISFTFAQIGDKDSSKTKKLLRIAVDGLPKIPSIPLIGDLVQPFDALQYLWVRDSGGFLKSEVTALNRMPMSASLQMDKFLQPILSVFLYAKLNGHKLTISAIIALESAEITGVQMGFGYNSFVRAPDINELTSFQFIDDGVKARLVLEAILSIPYVELGLAIDFNMAEGYFRVEVALAPTSFLLVPQCQLAGGFALVTGLVYSNPHGGDLVSSVGGYHPQYQVLDWVVMGGALIHASLDLGPLRARFDAQLDCLINFHPLYEMAELRVSVGVSFTIDILFIHIHISASIGADLVVQGPEFGGTAHVYFGASPAAKLPLTLLQFWEMLHQPDPNVSLKNAVGQERVQAVVTYDPRADFKGTMVPAPKGTGTIPYQTPTPQIVETAALKYVLKAWDGAYRSAATASSSTEGTASRSGTASDSSNTGQDMEWFVEGSTFKFHIETEFALSYTSVASAVLPVEDSAGAEVPVLNGGPHPIKTNTFSRPVQITEDITSESYVTIVETASKKIIGGWTDAAFNVKSVPTGT
ncbi:hypothetical protein BKA56DRAFT_615696 [Ilyonectria sp. MPI-CAGE-AT-0026]|nr:hypothetical protein BKA56DRAFT_615696 [Ilyonectria sp. MPI-CAGE-AT-0026]